MLVYLMANNEVREYLLALIKIAEKINNIMEKGTVKFFNQARGFGFITTEQGQELFVHVSGLADNIRENDSVEFEVQDGKKGLNAFNVKLA